MSKSYWKSLLRALNVVARVFGLVFTAAGIYFAGRGVYFIIQPEMAGVPDTLGFAPWFRPLVIAAVLLIIGVHFLRGGAHRPDLPRAQQTDRTAAGRPRSWWTGEPGNE